MEQSLGRSDIRYKCFFLRFFLESDSESLVMLSSLTLAGDRELRLYLLGGSTLIQ